MDFDCPACNHDEDIQFLYDEKADDTTFILWGKCGHSFNLEGDIEKEVEKQRKNPSKYINRGF